MNPKQLLEQSIGIPFTEGNKVEILRNGVRIFPAMLEAIEQAQDNVDFLTFVYWQGKIAETFAQKLAKKAQEGVKVRVLLDGYGSRPMRKELIQHMKDAGVEVITFRPLMRWKIWKSDNRTHRKILICDDEVAFTGGVGIAEEWEGDARNEHEWRETHFKIKGPAVWGIKSAFIENWIEANDELLPELFSAKEQGQQGSVSIQTVRTSSSVRWSDIVLLYQSLLRMAKERIYICTAYFNPDDVLLNELIQKSNEGLDVRLIVPGGHIDKRISKVAAEDVFEPLIRNGVQVHYYTRTMMHAKILLVDNEVSCVGSANFNHRSMLKDDEINLVMIDRDINQALTDDYFNDLQHCERVTQQRWKRRSTVRKAKELLTRPVKDEL
ncbi:MAG TPA: cardiolipin synthase B [Balneolaceae bacterium]|nr:cardiolipin synthase B [Balneolaceae bacterium]